MSDLSCCPECTRWVRVPGALDSRSIVRCPLCGKEFPLEEVLRSGPPTLEVVTRVEPVAAAPFGQDEEDSAASCGGPPGGLAAAGESAGVPQIDLGDAEAGLSIRLHDEPQGDRPGPDSAPAADPITAEGSTLGKLAGVVGGGMVGLAIGYLVLLWIGGPAKDFLQIGHRLPALLVPASFDDFDPLTIDDGPLVAPQPLPAPTRGLRWREFGPAGQQGPAENEARPPTGAAADGQ